VVPGIDRELDAAIAAISDPERMRAAQELVAKAAPELQRVLARALADGGWFDTAHDAAVQEAIGADDHADRVRAVKTLFAEETRLSMLVGVAVGFELARELRYRGLDSVAGTAGGPQPRSETATSHEPGPDPEQED
jgi:hypothetical protein